MRKQLKLLTGISFFLVIFWFVYSKSGLKGRKKWRQAMILATMITFNLHFSNVESLTKNSFPTTTSGMVHERLHSDSRIESIYSTLEMEALTAQKEDIVLAKNPSVGQSLSSFTPTSPISGKGSPIVPGKGRVRGTGRVPGRGRTFNPSPPTLGSRLLRVQIKKTNNPPGLGAGGGGGNGGGDDKPNDFNDINDEKKDSKSQNIDDTTHGLSGKKKKKKVNKKQAAEEKVRTAITRPAAPGKIEVRCAVEDIFMKEAVKTFKDQRIEKFVIKTSDNVANLPNINQWRGDRKIHGTAGIWEMKSKDGGREYLARTEDHLTVYALSNKENQDNVIKFLQKFFPEK